MAGTGGKRDKGLGGPTYCSGFERVRRLELVAIKRRWRKQKLPEPCQYNLSGIAVSGGGIRSASFSLGAMQKLAHAGLLRDAHYLSTVSGGGYMGASLTWYLSRSSNAGPCYGTDKDNFPFLGGEAASNRRSGRGSTDDPQEDRPPPDGRTIVDFIRQRSSYLVPGRGLGLVSAFGIVLRSMVTSLFAYFLLFALLWLLLTAAGFAQWPRVWGVHPVFWAALGLAVLLPATAIVYSIAAPSPFLEKASYTFRRRYQEVIGYWLGWAVALALFGLWFVLVSEWKEGRWLLLDLPLPGAPGAGTAAAASAGTVTIGGALLGLLGKKLADSAPRFFSWLLPVLPPLALFLLFAGLGTLGALAAELLAGQEVTAAGRWTIIGLALLYLVYANINLTGLHRFYRDRLMEAFMPDLKDVHDDEPSSQTSANRAQLCRMFDPACMGPYHLVNANMVMLDSKHARYRSRQSDSFVLAPHYCGSEATGWARTDRWMAERHPWIIRPIGPMTLATAMAISGAAVNPNTGADGRGVTKTAALSALLTILNIRLGHWASSPRRLSADGSRGFNYPPNFLMPGLVKGIFGRKRTESSGWLDLTDGGHFDNIGLYELVRRRVRTIFVIDGTEDRTTSFSSFANAAEKAYIDFAVQLKFEDEDGFIKLLRGADPGEDPRNKAFQLAERGYAVGTIEYPAIKTPDGAVVEPAMVGTLFYLKATLTRGLPEALYSYRADNDAFPWQSTADQFFDEQQFEAYRTLGFALAAQLAAHIRRPAAQAPAAAEPAS